MSRTHDIPELLRVPVWQASLRVAVPAMIGFGALGVFSLVDAFWVGRLGADAVAGFTAVTFVTWVMYSLAMIPEIGVNSLVAQAVGAEDTSRAGRVVRTGALVAVAYGAACTAAALALRGPVLDAMALPPAARAQADALYVPMIAGMIGYFPFVAINGAFRGLGDTVTTAVVLVSALSLNGLLDPLFIFGWGPVPALGLGGAGWASLVAKLTAAMIIAGFARARGFFAPAPREQTLNAGDALDLLRIGTPIGLNGVLFSLTYVAITRVLAGFGAASVAALGIGNRVEGIAWFMCVGFGIASATISGQAVGAGHFRLGRAAVFRGAGVLALLLSPLWLGMVLFGDVAAALFVDPDHEGAARAVAEGGTYLRIVGATVFFLGFEAVFEEALGGAGRSLPALVIGGAFTLIRVPLAWALAVGAGLGPDGVWAAIAVTTVVKGALLAVTYWVLMGRMARAAEHAAGLAEAGAAG